jgi:c(7)-type cytochrome triheme protein
MGNIRGLADVTFPWRKHMFKLRLLLIVLLGLALPSVLYAVGMGNMGGGMGMGGMGAMTANVLIRTKTVGTVPFSHNVHFTRFQCNACHPKIFKQKANSNHVTMQAMEKGRSCGACHNGKRAFSVKEKVNCVKCHTGAKDILFKNEDAGNVIFPHSVHIEMFECKECHPSLFKAKHGANKMTMEAMENGKFCGACHDGDTAFSVADACDSCHQM